jgi:hypothetical protein
MNPKITPEHLSRRAIVYIRQSSPGLAPALPLLIVARVGFTSPFGCKS